VQKAAQKVQKTGKPKTHREAFANLLIREICSTSLGGELQELKYKH
jgi:hypothetical protein